MLFKDKSKIDGLGIYTDKPITKGESFYNIPREKFSQKPHKKWARIGNRYVCDEKILNFINHSCEPNAKIDGKEFVLISLKNIEPNEEITVDYDRTEKRGIKIECNCQSPSCRGYFFINT